MDFQRHLHVHVQLDTIFSLNIDWVMAMASIIRRTLDRLRHSKTVRYNLPTSRHPLQPNDFLGPEIVFYHSEKTHPTLLQYLSDHYDRIDASLQEKGMRFIFFPKARPNKNKARIEELSAFVSYRYPGLHGMDKGSLYENLQDLLGQVGTHPVHEGLQAALGMPVLHRPALVHRIHSMTDSALNAQNLYSFALLDTEDRRRIHAQVEQYLHRVRYAQDEVYFQLAQGNDEYDADDRFDLDGGAVNDEVRRAVQSLRESDNEKMLVSSLLFIIRTLKDARPDIVEKLQSILGHTHIPEATDLSRLVIDDQFRILLPDHGREVEISPLPKSFYLFMLRHPEGVMFRDLSKHRSELIDIYGRVGNRLDRTAIETSIDDLINPRSNSVNEKCSRIKEGFLRTLDDRIARHYYITGDRNGPKRVALDRSLLVLPEGY
jgi:hypothetical protein